MTSTAQVHLLTAAAELGAALIGLVVSHRARTMTLTGRPGFWEAVTLAEPDGVEEHDVEGFGETVQAALDACADEAELVEADATSGDDGDSDEGDE